MEATIFLKDNNIVIQTTQQRKLIPSNKFSIDPNGDNISVYNDNDVNLTFHYSDVTGVDDTGASVTFSSVIELEDYLSPFVNFKEGGDTGGNGGVVLGIENYYNFSQTQWNTNLATDLTVPTGSNVNLFSLLDNTDKSIGGTTSYDEYDINASDLIVVPYIGRPYEGLRIKHDIRINFNIVTGNTQNYKIELRRFDNSVIGSPIKVTRNADETGVQEVLLTYVSSITDSFVTGGFYISFTNDSGSTCELTGGLGVLIFNTFQKPVKFI